MDNQTKSEEVHDVSFKAEAEFISNFAFILNVFTDEEMAFIGKAYGGLAIKDGMQINYGEIQCKNFTELKDKINKYQLIVDNSDFFLINFYENETLLGTFKGKVHVHKSGEGG